MIDVRKIRETVIARMKIIGRADEDLIHSLYSAALSDALQDARNALAQIDRKIEDRRAYNEKIGWTMMSKEQREELHSHVKQLRAMITPDRHLENALSDFEERP